MAQAPAAHAALGAERVEVFVLFNAKAEEILDAVKTITPVRAALVPSMNTVIIRSNEKDVLQAIELIQRMDIGRSVAPTDIVFSITLKHASAAHLKNIFEKLLQEGFIPHENTGISPSVISDNHTNTLIFHVDERQSARVQALASQLDREPPPTEIRDSPSQNFK